MIGRRLAVIVAGAAVVLSACNTAASPSGGAGGSGAASGCTVGVSWNNYSQERWKKADEPAMVKAIAAKGGKYIRADANDKAEQQLTDIDTLMNQGAKVLIVLAKDSEAIKPAIAKATAAGVKVIAYDRLIEDPNTFYITFDNKKVGTLMAETLKKLVPAGNYAIILGAETDPNSAFLRSGMTEAGIPKLGDTSGPIKVVFEKNTDNWDTTNAKNNMEQALNQTNNKIDAVLSENDSMATGVVQALSAVGLKVPDDLPKAAAPASLNATAFQTPKGNTVQSIVLTPTAITKDNVKDTIDAGWVTKEAVCQGVAAGSTPACG